MILTLTSSILLKKLFEAKLRRLSYSLLDCSLNRFFKCSPILFLAVYPSDQSCCLVFKIYILYPSLIRCEEDHFVNRSGWIFEAEILVITAGYG